LDGPTIAVCACHGLIRRGREPSRQNAASQCRLHPCLQLARATCGYQAIDMSQSRSHHGIAQTVFMKMSAYAPKDNKSLLG